LGIAGEDQTLAKDTFEAAKDDPADDKQSQK
jgi:hypothetical protein